MTVKRVLPIKLSSKCKVKVRSFIYDVAQFQNLLRIFVLEWDKKTYERGRVKRLEELGEKFRFEAKG